MLARKRQGSLSARNIEVCYIPAVRLYDATMTP